MKKFLLRTLQSLLVLVVLGGCLAPDESSESPEILSQHITAVQQAVDQYRQQFGTLPVRGDHTLSKEERVVHFVALEEMLEAVPSSAFEKGGHFYYVLIGPETSPVVKLFDLRVSKVLSEVQLQVDTYVQRKGHVPRAEKIGPKVYMLDFAALDMEPVTVPSPYTPGLSLPLVITEKGKVYVDYRADVMRKVQEAGRPAEKDLREWLVDETLFAPAHWLPIRLEQGEPVFADEP